MNAFLSLPITIICSCSILLLIGCSPTMVMLDSTYEPQDAAKDSSLKLDYQLLIKSVNDIRKDKSSLGTLGLADVSSDDMIGWLKNALLHRGYNLDAEIDPEKSACELDISLKLAYIRSSSTSKATNIVLAIKHDSNDELVYYRGTHAGMNWNSTESEIETSFSLALEEALNTMEAGLSESCLASTSAKSI